MSHQLDMSGLESAVGQEIYVSDWLPVTQAMINDFADLTGDRQWIHLDEDRARKESPYGATVAHGYLILSLIPRLIDPVPPSLKAKGALNYGLEKLRFPGPVRAGQRIRARQKVLVADRTMGNSLKLVSAISVEVEGEEKPACYAETIVIYFS